MFKMNKGGVKHPTEKSAKVHVPVGGGSRPTTGKIAIPTSAPAMAHTLDSRAPKGFLR